MSGVWNFNANGVASREENPLAQTSFPGPSSGHKILVHVESNETMTSYEQLDAKMLTLGWHVYAHGNPNTKQYHRSYNTPDLITLPISFHGIRTTHMYDIVVKTRSAFQVQNAPLGLGHGHIQQAYQSHYTEFYMVDIEDVTLTTPRHNILKRIMISFHKLHQHLPLNYNVRRVPSFRNHRHHDAEYVNTGDLDCSAPRTFYEGGSSFTTAYDDRPCSSPRSPPGSRSAVDLVTSNIDNDFFPFVYSGEYGVVS